MARHGFIFESEIGKSLKILQNNHELLYWKLIDTHLYDYHLYCPHCNQPFDNPFIVPKAIADYLVITHKGVKFMECKSSKAELFPIGNIQPHQLKWSLQCNYYNVPYYFLICDRRLPKNFKCYGLLGTKLDDLIAEVSPKKSIKWGLLKDCSKEVKRLEGGLWEIEELVR